MIERLHIEKAIIAAQLHFVTIRTSTRVSLSDLSTWELSEAGLQINSFVSEEPLKACSMRGYSVLIPRCWGKTAKINPF